jgi:hypothetical protein
VAKRTGKDLNILIDGTAISVSTGWSVEDQDVNVETTAAGDAVVDRESLRGDFTMEWNARVEAVSPYVLPYTVRGTRVAFVCEVIAADAGATGLVGGTGLCTMFRIESAFDQPMGTSGRIQAAGTALTYDMTPAT